MKSQKYIFIFCFFLPLFVTGCIHDHPNGEGVDPSSIEAAVELVLELNWGENETKPFYKTKGRNDDGPRCIVEFSRGGIPVGRDEFIVSPSEMEEGKILHKLDFNLHALRYEVAVWMENPGENDNDYSFNANDLSNVFLMSSQPSWNPGRQVGYSSEIIDLTPYKGKWGVKLIKEMELQHAGARFRLVATDIRQFIYDEIDNIEKGEKYTVSINYSSQSADAFNAYTGKEIYNSVKRIDTSDLLLHYDIFGEIDLTEGFVFCSDEDEISMYVTVENSARQTIVRSTEFSFPVKRGMVSIVKGEFLSERFTNFITVDNIWEGEIVIDL